MKMLNPLEGSVLKMWPEGHIRQWYGANPQWYNGVGHPGVDIARARGTNVLAAHSGVVQNARTDPKFHAYGLFVTILGKDPQNEQVEYITQYGHLLDITVEVGQEVEKGQVIGHEGNTGFVVSDGGASRWWGDAPANKGNHLHFNVFKFVNKQVVLGLNNMNTIDPMPFLVDEESMKYIIDGKQNQYLVFDNPRIAVSIADGEELYKLKTRGGLSSEPQVGEVPESHIIYPGVESSRLIDIFNL